MSFDYAAKEDAIAKCLQGSTSSISNNDVNNGNHAESVVDLWRLRELALSRGGLLSPEWRKRAWPKLVASHEQMMKPASLTTPRALSRAQVQALQTDLRTTVWNIEAELRRRKEERQQEQANIDAKLEEERLRNKKVKFSPIVEYSDNEEDEELPGALRSTPTNSEDGEDASTSSRFSYTEQGVNTPSTTGTQDISFVSLLSLSSTNSSRAVRGRKASIHEQRILYTLLTNLLKHSSSAQEDATFCFTYHPGFQDLVSILLYNVESPTVTSMILPQLASHHWRFLLSSKSQLEGFLSATFMPLLEQVDARLALHLQSQGMRLPTFCRSWVATWFASDCGEAAAASRLLDVLLVSHPFMVVYLSVAWVCEERQQLLALQDFVILAKTLRSLPLEATQEASDLETVESVIARALQYIKRVPPHQLESIVQNLDTGALVGFSADDVPSWMMANVAPSDMAIIKKQWNIASVQDSGEQIQRSLPSCPLAMVATGRPIRETKVGRRCWGKWIVFLSLVCFAVFGATHFSKASQTIVSTMYLSSSTRSWLFNSQLKPTALISHKSVSSAKDYNTGTTAVSVSLRPPTGGRGAAQPVFRSPWWRRVRHAVRRLFRHFSYLEKWFAFSSNKSYHTNHLH